jgi:hypothetical protein
LNKRLGFFFWPKQRKRHRVNFELTQDVVVPTLTRTGLLEKQPGVGVHLEKRILDIGVRGLIEFGRELTAEHC